jgi:exodeoxyribonuclease-5
MLAVSRWMQSGGQGIYRMFGYAGTGKTTLAKEFASGIGGTVLYAAFTGKAASVLRSKGCDGATTIHKLIYKPAEKSKETLRQINDEMRHLSAELAQEGLDQKQIDEHPDMVKLTKDFEDEKFHHKRPKFTLNPDSVVKDAKLLVVDEVSMVDAAMGLDLESFNVPILVLGDPAQLPPVMGAGYFINGKPDVLLTEIHRQAEGNPILRLATDVREGRGIRKGTYGDSRVIGWGEVDKEEVMRFDQVLVGTNKRRHQINGRCRELLGREPGTPVPTDRLVCLRNNHELGLLNGGLWNVEKATVIDENEVDLDLKCAESDNRCAAPAHTAYFLGKEPPFWDIRERECFDYGYALTVHKSQGSQWDKCYIFDESKCFRQDARKWLYTALTRAAKQAVVVTD